MNSIEEKEASFHDIWASDTDLSSVFVNQAFETNSSPENKKILEWMGSVKDKKILELGCGLGEASVYLAKLGANVLATDISPLMVKRVQELAKYHHVKVESMVVSANNLNNVPNDSFDYAYAGNLLHHVNIELCVKQVQMKLKDGGIAFFWDPIAYNPLINIYRRIARKVRTEDEHPLRVKDIKTIRDVFPKVDLEFFWLTSLSVFAWYFISGVDPNKDRYWKKILREADKVSWFLKISQAIDRLLFKIIPPLKYLAWNVVIKAQK
jgi:SAM-dependent methyltransferase